MQPERLVKAASRDVLSASFDVSLLTEMAQPVGGSFEMKNPDSSPRYSLNCVTSGESGALLGLRLPTRGQVEWDYGVWDLTQNNETTWGDNPPPAQTLTLGVTERRTLKADGTLIGTWEYENELWPFDADQPEDKPRETRTYVKNPDGSCSTHYYDANPGYVASVQADPGWAYGLPFSEESTKSGGYYLSVEQWTGTQSVSRSFNTRFECSGTALRRNYVEYDHDVLPGLPFATWNANGYQVWHDSNRRLEAQRTVYVDDGNRYAGAVSSDFDGLGHYRTATTNGNFNAGNVRTTTTNVNPSNGTYPNAGYSPPAVSADWILNTFADRSVTEGATTYKEQFCFESSTGFLLRRRTQADTTRQAKDFIVDYTSDVKGFTTFERYYGGEGVQNNVAMTQRGVSTDLDLCGIILAADTEEFEIEQSPGVGSPPSGYGTLRWIRYNERNGSWSVAPVHRDIDANTGLPDETIDISALRVDYTYDKGGRPTIVQPETDHKGARTKYDYTNAASTTPAQVDIVEEPNDPNNNNKLSERRIQFDGFGRVIREERKRPNESWVGSTIEYTPRGFTKRVSTTWTGTPTTWTTTTYDEFGRPLTITPPDGSSHNVTLSYAGVRVVNRTVNIRTGSGETPQTTTEEYDRLGRLYKVTEPNGTVTTYDYDPSDRIKSVSMTGDGVTQTRMFNYDGRGVLISEAHPEKTNPVMYNNYDARGHATQKIDGNSDLTFIYDRSERVTTIKETNGNVLKTFSYAIANDGTNRRQGKLESAKRHNYLPELSNAANVEIQEDYLYRGVGGRATRRTTYKNGGEVFRLGSSYDTQGQRTLVCYPKECSGGGTEVLSVYTKGFLTKVDGYADVIAYHANLMLQRVEHNNGVDDHWDVANRMRRPAKIYTTGSTDANFDTGTYVYDGAGNISNMGDDFFTYDSVSRLVDADITVTSGHHWEENTFDAFGNRIAATTTSPSNPLGLLRTNPTDPSTNRLEGTTSRPISYDLAGNMTQWGTATYSYDELHMQKRLQDGTDNEYHVYTANDERVAVIETNNSNTQNAARWMIRDFGNQVVRTYTQGTYGSSLSWDKDYIHREGQMLARKTSSGVEYAHIDHLGTPRYWTKANASAAKRHDYLPFGEEVTIPSMNPEPIQFTGHERDGHLSGGCGSGTTVINGETISTGQQRTGCDVITSDTTTVTSMSEVRFTAGERIELGENFVVADGAHFVAEIDGNIKADRQDLDYMHARYCSPYLGRFSNVDPVVRPGIASRLPQLWNLYAYAAGNPMKFVDPTGLFIDVPEGCGSSVCEEVVALKQTLIEAGAPEVAKELSVDDNGRVVLDKKFNRSQNSTVKRLARTINEKRAGFKISVGRSDASKGTGAVTQQSKTGEFTITINFHQVGQTQFQMTHVGTGENEFRFMSAGEVMMHEIGHFWITSGLLSNAVNLGTTASKDKALEYENKHREMRGGAAALYNRKEHDVTRKADD